MSRRINFWPVDYEFLTAAVGTGDASIKDQLSQQCKSDRSAENKCDWDDAIRIATSVIDNGFPPQNDTVEHDCHFFASQMLSLSCQLNRRSPDSEFHWLSFLEAIDVCFPGTNSKMYEAFSNGRPWFGSECPFETIYGIIPRNEVPRIVESMSNHRDEFGNDADWMLDPQKAFFEFVFEHNTDVWYAA